MTTTKPQHSPEPWRIDALNMLVDAHGNGVDVANSRRRIVACVNACEGLIDPPSAIGLWKSEMRAVDYVVADRDALRAENEKLREALRKTQYLK